MTIQNAQVIEAGHYANISATANISAVPSRLIGVLCSTTSSGTLNVYNDTSTGTTNTVTGTITLTAGQFYPIPARCGNGIYLVIGGTANITAFFDA